MSINGNGSNKSPRPPGDGRDVRRRRLSSNSDSDSDAQNGNRTRRRRHVTVTIDPTDNHIITTNNGLQQRVVTSVRNLISHPVTVAVGVAAASAFTSQLILWLFGGASSTVNNSLSIGLPNLGGEPPPPPLNPTQNNGPIPQDGPHPHIPTLEEILANAGYPPEEQLTQQGSEPLEPPSTEGAQGAEEPQSEQLPPCPEEAIFIGPMLGAARLNQPSQTRQRLTNGEVSDLCSGPAPRVAVQPVAANRPRFQCWDTTTGAATTSCTVTNPAQECPPNQQLEQCAGLRLSGWAEEIGTACVRARELNIDAVIVLEDTPLPQESGAAATTRESDLFDAEIHHHCNDGNGIYSEEPPFEGASGYARDRVQFDATPEDILRHRRRDAYRAQRAAEERARQTAEQEDQ
ncbi:MAG: hypothetical protein ACRC9R_12120, partial [Enterovibrio sp.]